MQRIRIYHWITCEQLQVSFMWLWEWNFMISKLPRLPTLRASFHRGEQSESRVWGSMEIVKIPTDH